MADRIFPNRYQEEPLDSDLVYQAINWDNFNTKLAEVQNGVNVPELPAEFKEVLAKKKSEDMPEEVEKMFKEKNVRDDEDADDLSDVPEQLREFVKKKQEKAKGKKSEAKSDDEEPVKPVKTDEAGWKDGKNMKKANSIVFNHPSQLSAEAVEAAIAEGNQELANAILAARHERRVRLANKIETRIAAETERSVKLAQRKAYRENLVKMASENTKTVKTAKKTETVEEDGFVKVSQLNQASKQAFASKALAQGFPKEYVEAILGESKVEVADNTVEIRNVMSSELSENVKKAAVSSMVKVATLSDADYSRLIDYWKNELGYGDQEWIDALFTKKYDK